MKLRVFAIVLLLFCCTALNAQNTLPTQPVEHSQHYFAVTSFFEAAFFGILLLAAVFNFSFFLFVKERVNLFFSLFLITFAVSDSTPLAGAFFPGNHFVNLLSSNIIQLSLALFVLFVRCYFKTVQASPKWDKFLIAVAVLLCLQFVVSMFWTGGDAYLPQLALVLPLLLAITALFITILMMRKRAGVEGGYFLAAVAPVVTCLFLVMVFAILGSLFTNGVINRANYWIEAQGNRVISACICWAVITFSMALFSRYNKQTRLIAQQQVDKERLAKEREMERNTLIAQQKIQLEQDVAERTAELRQSLADLKAAQSQLVHAEKMASLGELTAGIAHEIQNPLNFVNNFSDVNKDILGDIKAERLKPLDERDEQLLDELINDIAANEEKINHHGRRAEAIVKGMLQHSRKSTGIKEPADINSLADEYLRLAYHGLRAKDKSFNAALQSNFDEGIGKINIMPQDIGRVLLNMFNNAFYAVQEKAKTAPAFYKPTVDVTTGLKDGKVVIMVKDNGTGIPAGIRNKIMQPFFTTKPTGQGTGLGLSLSYDIIKAHNGEIKIDSEEGEGTVFTVVLPV